MMEIQAISNDDEISVLPPRTELPSGDADYSQQQKQLYSSTEDFALTPPRTNVSLLLGEMDYNKQLNISTQPRANISTAAYFGGPAIGFRSGYRNMAQKFLGTLLINDGEGQPQILMESLKWRDQGSGVFIPHQELFDVVHWNKFFPDVPHIVAYDPELHSDVDVRYYKDTTRVDWKREDPYKNSTRPYAIVWKENNGYMAFRKWSKHIEQGIGRGGVVLKAFEGALRPHPAIQEIIDKFMASLEDENLMVLHARVEPDMQRHLVCADKKVTNFTDILNSLYAQFPEPPVRSVLVILNRAGLEEEVTDPNSENQLAVHNLRVLNDIAQHGLWGGKAKVIEAGTGLLENTEFHKNRLLVGGIINYYLALEAKVFVGTEISSYSSDVAFERFFRGQKQNFFYVPGEMKWVTPPGVHAPPYFRC